MMRRGLQVGFGELVDPSILDALRAVCPRLSLVRLRVGRDAAHTHQIVWQAVERGWRPLVIIDRPDQVFWLPADGPLDVELMNEPDIGTDNDGHGPIDPLEYRLALAEAYAAVWHRKCGGQDVRLWVGAVSNFTSRSFAFLNEVLPAAPTTVGVTIHWYPHHDLRGPHPGYVSREQELDAFRRLIGHRAWGVSETGWHTRPQRLSWWPWATPVAWTDQDVADTAADEFAWWAAAGAEYVVLYQLNDGLIEGDGDRYGIRRADGTWKPVVRVFQERPHA